MSKETRPMKGEAFFDSEEYFKAYDHEAVLDLSRRTLIAAACYNRKNTVENCLGATFKHKLGAKLYVHDDSSDEYDVEWLKQFGDRVYRHPRSLGGKKGVKNLRSNISKSVLGDFQPSVFDEWLKEDFGEEGPEYLYHIDSDGYHDPYFFYRIHEMMKLYPDWGVITLYNAEFHSPKNGRKENKPIDYNTVIRSVSPGISMFFRVNSFRESIKNVQVPDGRGWDGFYSQTIAKRNVLQSLVSFVEHFGKGGIHNKGSWERDRAINPTKYLDKIRSKVLEDIEG